VHFNWPLGFILCSLYPRIHIITFLSQNLNIGQLIQ